MRKFTMIMLVFTVLMTSGCGTLFRKRITSDNLKSTREAAQVQERALSINDSSYKIMSEAKGGVDELKQEEKSGVINEFMFNIKKQRYERISEEAKIIEKLSALNAKSGQTIININSGEWYSTWWFKGIMIFLGLLFISAVAGYITFMMKQWGLLKGVRYMNEGLTEAVAAMVDNNENIDNESIYHEGIKSRLNKSGRYRQ